MIMEINYTTEEILVFLEGNRTREETLLFWNTVESDPQLYLKVKACSRLIEEARKKRFQKLLDEVKKFDEELPPLE